MKDAVRDYLSALGTRGATALNARRTPEERSAAAKRAVVARDKGREICQCGKCTPDCRRRAYQRRRWADRRAVA